MIAYRAPTRETVAAWSSRSGIDFITPTPDGDHELISPRQPDRAFARFDDDTVMRVARDAMPGVAIREARWLTEYDDYYYKTVSSFDLGLPRMAKTLPVLRVRYADAAQTWLYLTPSPGQILKVERQDRANRWGYYGLHGLDFAVLWRNRPLWDIVVVALLLGVGVSSVTSVVPGFRRLVRHARRLTARDHAGRGNRRSRAAESAASIRSVRLQPDRAPRRPIWQGRRHKMPSAEG